MVLRTLRDIFLGDPRAGRAVIEQRQALGGGRIIPWTAGKPTWPSRTIDTYDQGAYRKVGLIYRCVQELAGAGGTAPLRVYRRVGDEPQQVDDHAARQLLQQPNLGMGEARFFSFVVMNMAVTGFTVIEKERDNLGNVIGLWPLRSDWIRPVPRQQDAPDWEYRVPGYQEPFLLNARDVIAISWSDTPDQSPTGLGPLEVLLREVGIASTMTDFVKTFFDRGAMPLYVMVPSDDSRYAKQWEDQSVKDAFIAAWQRRYAGLVNAVDPMPLVGIKDIKPLGFDFNQLAFPDLNKMTEARICTTFGVPAILVGAEVGLERSTFSNTAEARRAFFEDTMTYLWARLDDAFTRHLLPEFEQDASFDIAFDTSDIPALQDDENDRVTRAVSLFSSGLVSRHNGQRHAGVKPHGSDVFLVPFNLVEMPNSNGTNGQRATAEIVWRDGRSYLTITETREPNGHAHDDFEIKHLAIAEPRIVTRDGRRYLNERALSDTERESRARIVDTHRTAILRLADKAEPVVQGYLDEQRERVVQAVTNQGRMLDSDIGKHYDGAYEWRMIAVTKSTRAIEDIDWQSESDTLLNLLQSWLDTVGEEAFALAATEIGLDDSMWRVSNEYLRNLVDMLGRRIVGITEHTRQDVERVVREALLEGTSMPDLAEKLEGLYSETYNGRSMTIARSESQVAFNTANVMAYDASGQVREAVLHDNSGHTESYGASDGLTCAQRNGLIVPLSLVSRHIAAEHPNGTLAVSPVVTPLEAE